MKHLISLLLPSSFLMPPPLCFPLFEACEFVFSGVWVCVCTPVCVCAPPSGLLQSISTLFFETGSLNDLALTIQLDWLASE